MMPVGRELHANFEAQYGIHHSPTCAESALSFKKESRLFGVLRKLSIQNPCINFARNGRKDNLSNVYI